MADQPRRIRQYKSKDRPLASGAVSVARGVFRNPWAPVVVPGWPTGARQYAVDDYRHWVTHPKHLYRNCNGGFPSAEASAEAHAALVAALPRLRGKDLACYCHEDQPCHADVLLDLANRSAS